MELPFIKNWDGKITSGGPTRPQSQQDLLYYGRKENPE